MLVSAHGANFTLNTSVHDTDFDWTLGDNYEGGSAPTGDADTVIIPADVIAKVTAGDNASYNLIHYYPIGGIDSFLLMSPIVS